jgi:hypothetical protein
MSVRRTLRLAGLAAFAMSLVATPMLAASPDVGVRVEPADARQVSVSPWIWEPDSSDSLRIAVGDSTRRIVVRIWMDGRQRRGQLIERRRSTTRQPWRTVLRQHLSAADLAGGSTAPDRTRHTLGSLLSFDAASLGVEWDRGLAYSVTVPTGSRLRIRFAARDERSHRWSGVTRTVRT